MNLIILTLTQKNLVDEGDIVGMENVSPANTFRYNLDKQAHIESKLGYSVNHLIQDSDSIVMWSEEMI